jgi:hypothetical protein
MACKMVHKVFASRERRLKINPEIQSSLRDENIFTPRKQALKNLPKFSRRAAANTSTKEIK